MKKLELKEQPKKVHTYMATSILNDARKRIKDFVAFEIPLLYKAIFGTTPNFEDDEEWRICTGDLEGGVYINIEVDNSYLDVEDRIYERREIAEIACALDGSIYLYDEGGNDWNADEISLEELTEISNKLEQAYIKHLNK